MWLSPLAYRFSPPKQPGKANIVLVQCPVLQGTNGQIVRLPVPGFKAEQQGRSGEPSGTGSARGGPYLGAPR